MTNIISSAFDLLLCAAGISAAVYVAGASICRMGRHPGPAIKHGWKLLYVAIFGLSLWMLTDMLGGQASMRDHIFAMAVAVYIHLTADIWRNSVPGVAKNNRTTGR